MQACGTVPSCCFPLLPHTDTCQKGRTVDRLACSRFCGSVACSVTEILVAALLVAICMDACRHLHVDAIVAVLLVAAFAAALLGCLVLVVLSELYSEYL